MRWLLPLPLLAALGCSSSPCRDVIEQHHLAGIHTADTYSECGKGCCKEDPRDCSCSNRCACWKKHSDQVRLVDPATGKVVARPRAPAPNFAAPVLPTDTATKEAAGDSKKP
jgi:hypothetical protein